MFTHKSFVSFLFAFLTLAVVGVTTASCSNAAVVSEAQQTEAQALESLRQMARGGQLPAESVVAGIEARFPNTRTAALARLLRAQILLNNGDALNASGLLDTNLIREKSAVGDYALWLRGQALLKAGKQADAATVFERLTREFPNSLRVREAKLSIAEIRSNSNETERMLSVLQDLLNENNAQAWLLVGKTYERNANLPKAAEAYRRIYYFAPVSPQAKEADEALKRVQTTPPAIATAEELLGRAAAFFKARQFANAATAYQTAATTYPTSLTPPQRLQMLTALANAKKTVEAAAAFNSIPSSAANERQQAYLELAEMYGEARLWAQARQIIDEMRRNFPTSPLVPKAYVNVGMKARDAKNKAEETFFLNTALVAYPNAVDVGKAQFELAWLQHEAGNFAASGQQLIEHLARYADKDTTYRGRAGYWAARNSERAGRFAEACFLYEAMLARYDANWYGYLSKQRLDNLNSARRCPATNNFAPDSIVGRAAANLKTVTVAPETAGAPEREKVAKSEDLSSVALFDWALEELNEAAKTAANSPKVNLGLARLHRYKGDNVSAFLALARSYPDYSQMKPEEMTREEWDIFYPLNYWDTIKLWARNRNLDHYQVAGLIRQESVFNPTAKSSANAFGLMQLILPTAKAMARKYNTASVNSGADLYNPQLNIELGTAYMRDQLDKYGRVEYLAVAYNAGPGRVVQWRNSLPYEMDEFVEAIPFRETKSYVQGVVRNTAQYRRLYDENGQFRAVVGSRPLRGEIDAKSAEQFAQEFPEIKLAGQNSEE